MTDYDGEAAAPTDVHEILRRGADEVLAGRRADPGAGVVIASVTDQGHVRCVMDHATGAQLLMVFASMLRRIPERECQGVLAVCNLALLSMGYAAAQEVH